MRKLLVVAAVVGLLTLLCASTVLAYTPVVGCTFAGTPDAPAGPWLFGGTVTARQNATDVVVGSGTLDANGCFSVPIGNGPSLTVTIDFTPGPGGDPADQYCTVPTDPDYTPEPYECSPIYTQTTPNAVSIATFTAAPLQPGLVGGVLGLAAFGLAGLRRAYRTLRG
jgi:hypothetical protein